MIINIDTNAISEKDAVLLKFLIGEVGAVAVSSATPAEEAAPAAKKAAAAKPAADPEPEAAPAADDGPTVDVAVKAAMEAVAQGKSAIVKAVVAELSAAKVSELEGEEIQTFLTNLEAALEADAAGV